jgi:hypothetical protein
MNETFQRIIAAAAARCLIENNMNSCPTSLQEGLSTTLPVQ